MKTHTRIRFLSGNEACAEGALAAGCRFYAGYPITPSTEIAEILSLRLPQLGGKFIQMEDEIASLAAVIGASIGGLKAMTATSGPGFSLMQENIGFAAMAEIPCVIVNVQRTGPSTGLPTQPAQGDVLQARWGTHGDHPIIALAPSTVRECFDLTVRAFNLSERYRTPVIILMDADVAHLREKVGNFRPRAPSRSSSGCVRASRLTGMPPTAKRKGRSLRWPPSGQATASISPDSSTISMASPPCGWTRSIRPSSASLARSSTTWPIFSSGKSLLWRGPKWPY